MPTINFSVGSPIAHHSKSLLDLPGHLYPIQVDLKDGVHTFTSQELELGTVHAIGGRTLIGKFAFGYTYHQDSHTITVCGTDYPSVDGMTLTTVPLGTKQFYTERAVADGLVADEVCRNDSWNHQSQLWPGAAQHFKDMVRDANEAFIAALQVEPKLNVQVRKKLPKLPLKEYLNLCSVYRNGKFLEVYDPTKHYLPQDEVKIPESTFGGDATFAWNAAFANVIGSTHDPHVNNLTWIELWERQFGARPAQCTSVTFPPGFVCSNSLVGGHIIMGTVPIQPATGSNSVYIIPICRSHNATYSSYMEAISNNRAVWLNHYFQ